MAPPRDDWFRGRSLWRPEGPQGSTRGREWRCTRGWTRRRKRRGCQKTTSAPASVQPTEASSSVGPIGGSTDPDRFQSGTTQGLFGWRTGSASVQPSQAGSHAGTTENAISVGGRPEDRFNRPRSVSAPVQLTYQPTPSWHTCQNENILLYYFLTYPFGSRL